MSHPHPFRQLDVFTDTPYRGNPVAVVHDADGRIPDGVTGGSPCLLKACSRPFSSRRASVELRWGTPAVAADSLCSAAENGAY